MDIKTEALREGYTLTPISFTLRLTLEDVRRGCDRASKVAAARGIAPTAASQRLRALTDRLGVLQEAGMEGKEKLFEVSDFGREVNW